MWKDTQNAGSGLVYLLTLIVNPLALVILIHHFQCVILLGSQKYSSSGK